MSAEWLNKLVVAKTAQGSVQFVGRCVSYTDAPTVTVNLADGTQAHWRADLCRVVEMSDEEFEQISHLFSVR